MQDNIKPILQRAQIMNKVSNNPISQILTGCLMSSILCMSITGSLAYAQSSELEEIIVTATKREESVQSVSSSISAISGEDLEARGITDFFDYAISIPNLSFGATDDGVLSGRSISIRGIQGANTTGVYIDDTPISETIDPRILELERIEVLRGPTGTLYGARSLGGTIRQITRKPSTDALTGKIRGAYSKTEKADGFNYLLNGSVNVPFSDNAAMLVSGFYEQEAGLFDRAIGTIADHFTAPATLLGRPDRVIEGVDDADTIAGQVSFFLAPTDRLTIEPRIMYQKTELDGFPLADGNPENFVQNRDFNTEEGGEDEWTLYTLNLNYDTDIGTVTSATSYFDREVFEMEGSGSFVNWLQASGFFNGFTMPSAPVVPDTTRLQTPLASPIFQLQEFESFTQELRFASELTGPWNFVAGVFYQNTDSREAYMPRNFAPGFRNDMTVGAIFSDLIFTSNTPIEIEELGFFGEISFDINDQWTVIFGERYFDIESQYTDRRAGLAAGVPLADDVPLSSIAARIDDEQSEDGFNFKVALEYQATDDLFFYGLVAEGFRLGGVNGFIPNRPAGEPLTGMNDPLGCLRQLDAAGLRELNNLTYDSDELLSYELGIKTDLSTDTRVNATVFYIDIKDIQQSVVLNCGFQLTTNFADARSQGIEFEFLTQISDQLQLGFNFGYTDAQFTEPVGNFIRNGDPLQQVPDWTASFNIDYFIPNVLQNIDFFARFDASYVDESISRVNTSANVIPRIRDGYEQLNLRFGLEDPDSFSAAIFVKNITDEIANLSDNRSIAAETPGRPRFVVSRPRTIGLELLYRF